MILFYSILFYSSTGMQDGPLGFTDPLTKKKKRNDLKHVKQEK